MWRYVGLARDAAGLRRALDRLALMESRLGSAWSPTASLLTNARLVTQAALARRESRGSHYRTDFPLADPAWRRRLRWTWHEEPGNTAWRLFPSADQQAHREIA